MYINCTSKIQKMKRSKHTKIKIDTTPIFLPLWMHKTFANEWKNDPSPITTAQNKHGNAANETILQHQHPGGKNRNQNLQIIDITQTYMIR